MKIDILAFGAHPDDVELGAGGTLAVHQQMGFKTGIIDLTFGELGTRGNKEIRLQEAEDARKVLNCLVRHNLGFRDGFFVNDEAHQLEVIRYIRKYKPEIILCNAKEERHPDHIKAAELLIDASFYAGLEKIKTEWDGVAQQAWRPKNLYHYMQFFDNKPDLLIDISSGINIKMESILAHRSQFFDPQSKETETLIAQPAFLENIKGRASYYGQFIGAKYAEGFSVNQYIGTKNLFHLL